MIVQMVSFSVICTKLIGIRSDIGISAFLLRFHMFESEVCWIYLVSHVDKKKQQKAFDFGVWRFKERW